MRDILESIFTSRKSPMIPDNKPKLSVDKVKVTRGQQQTPTGSTFTSSDDSSEHGNDTLVTGAFSTKSTVEMTRKEVAAQQLSKRQKRHEWLFRPSLLRGTSLSPNCSAVDPQLSGIPFRRVGNNHLSRRSYVAHSSGTCSRTSLRSQDVEGKEEDKANDVLYPGLLRTAKTILTGSEFLDFVFSCMDDHMQRITARVVRERVPSSSSSGLIKSASADHLDDSSSTRSPSNKCNRGTRRRVSKYEEFQLFSCPSTPITSYMPPVILIPGGGIFYFWKAGFTMYLSKHFDLSRCIFVGTSAGALASVVTLVSDNIARVSRLAIKMAVEKQVWNKPYFLAGVLHNLAGQWLERIIAQDFDVQSLRNRLLVIAYRVSRVRLEGFCQFQSRRDLIDCVLASIHIPFYANGRPAVKARGKNYLDGSFGSDIIKTFAQEIPPEKIVLIRCNEGDYITPVSRRDCIRKLPPNGLMDLFRSGFTYAEKLHRKKKLTALKTFEIQPPGSFSIANDPYLDFNRLDDNTLD